MRHAIDLIAAHGPYPPLRERLMLYGRFVGSWAVESTEYAQDGAVTQSRRGEWHFGWVLGGHAVQDVLFAEGAPPHERGTTLRCFDADADVWHVTWMQPADGEVSHLVGRADGDRIVQDVIDRDERWTFSDISHDAFSWRSERSGDGGATWWPDHVMLAARLA